MKHYFLLPILFLITYFPLSGQIISQYIETSSGTSPKGIEIWNSTLSEFDFSTNNLVIEKGTNGSTPAVDFSITSGTLSAGKVIVIGTSDLQAITENNGSSFFLKSFTFNGDDALVVKYGEIITDVFGIPGSDPGTAWAGSGVSTANQNIALKDGIVTGDIDGWINPSERFETITTDNSPEGFGLAPIIITGTLQVQPTVLNDFYYILNQGPGSSQFFTISGTELTNNVIITTPADYEISTDNILFHSSTITLSASSGTLPQTSIYVRLKTGLQVGRYINETISITSVGATEVTVSCNGRVYYSAEMQLPNAWINEFHYDNIGTDINEFIEVVIENASLFNLADFTVSLYNGGDGMVYDSESVNHFFHGSTKMNFSLYTWAPTSIQNGSPDGFSINYKDEAILFLSYEGIFTATNGPASGMVSSDIGTSQSNSKTFIGYSLQLVGSGNQYFHFHWIDPIASPGSINSFQFFGDYMPPVPIDYRIILILFMLIALRITYIKMKI